MRILSLITLALGTAACATTGPIEENVSVDFPFVEETQQVGEDTISFFETGEGNQTVVMMHGIPVTSYLWRNVAPIVGEEARVMAFDLPGYGKSSVPANGDNTYPSLYDITEDFLNERPEEKFVLVVTDLGSVIGLDYAMRNQDRIAGIVMLESVFMPAAEWYKQLTFVQKVGFKVMRNDWMARKFFLDRPRAQRSTINYLTIRKLSDEEIGTYMAPYEDPAYRRVILEGPGPTTTPPGLISREPNDIAAVIDRNAAAIRESDIPVLLLTAEPGFIVQDEAIDWAKENIKNLTVKSVGAGRHFVTEDQPTAIGEAIRDWVVETVPEPENYIN